MRFDLNLFSSISAIFTLLMLINKMLIETNGSITFYSNFTSRTIQNITVNYSSQFSLYIVTATNDILGLIHVRVHLIKIRSQINKL